MGEDVLVLPYAEQGLVGQVYESARVLSEADNEAGYFLKVRDLPAPSRACNGTCRRPEKINSEH
jgi:hypothetical protein